MTGKTVTLDYNLERADVREQGLDLTFTLNPEEKARLESENDLAEINAFSAPVHVRPWHGADGLALEGRIEADIVQTCSVTGEEIATRISEPFTVHLLTEAKIRKMERRQEKADDEIIIDVDADDPPDVLGKLVSPGSYVTEYFTLFIDPYPRKEGVEVEAGYSDPDPDEDSDAQEEPRDNPFAVLSSLKKND